MADCDDCGIRYDADGEPRPDFCPLHANAGKLKDALEKLLLAETTAENCFGYAVLQVRQEDIDAARAVLAEAEERT